MKRFTLLSLLPAAALACANAKSNECAGYMANNAAEASAFCATFTQSVVTETAGLPAWATACKSKPKQISKECSCHFAAGGEVAPATEAADDVPVQTEVPAVATTLATVVAPVETEEPAAEEPASSEEPVAEEPAASSAVEAPATSAVAEEPSSPTGGEATEGGSCGAAAVDELVGYGDGTTGGGSGDGVTVTSCSELTSAVANGGVIKVDGNLSGCDIVRVESDTSIIGVGSGSGLTGGGFRMKDVTNVILRNLKMNNPPEGKDLIDIESSTYIWFSDHWKASLIGHSDSNADEDTGKLHVTYHHNYWSNINSRAPSIRFGTAHIYSSCYEDVPTSGVNSRMGAQVLVEQTSFNNVNRAIVTNLDSDEDGFAAENGNLYTNSETQITQEKDFTPPYSYTTDPASCICELVKAKAGTGVVA
ncbi:hypothetical protein ACJZ2D_012684 [Fusarium nematophilum]